MTTKQTDDNKANKVSVCLARQPLTPCLAGAAEVFVPRPGFSSLDESGTGPVPGDTTDTNMCHLIKAQAGPGIRGLEN